MQVRADAYCLSRHFHLSVERASLHCGRGVFPRGGADCSAMGSCCMIRCAYLSASRGTVVHRVARPVEDPTADVRIVQPSGVIVLAADVVEKDGEMFARSATLYRTQRRMFEGYVCVPASKVPNFVNYQQQHASAAE